jgi:hypothetical protein
MPTVQSTEAARGDVNPNACRPSQGGADNKLATAA